MSSTKATHKGTCQVCGRLQKLPAGSLSKHGYTVEWGYFSGVCPGAHELPLEQDRSVLDRIMVELEAEADCLEAPDTEPATVVCDVAYRPKSFRNRSVISGRVENSLDAFRALAMTDENRERWSRYGWHEYKRDENGLARDAAGDLVEDTEKAITKRYARAVEAARAEMLRQAKSLREHAKHMRALAETTHGNELQAID